MRKYIYPQDLTARATMWLWQLNDLAAIGALDVYKRQVVDGAGNASGQTATAKVYIDPAPPNVPGIALSTEQWTNSMVTAAIKDNGDAHSGVARTEYSLDGGSWTAYSLSLIHIL